MSRDKPRVYESMDANDELPSPCAAPVKIEALVFGRTRRATTKLEARPLELVREMCVCGRGIVEWARAAELQARPNGLVCVHCKAEARRVEVERGLARRAKRLARAGEVIQRMTRPNVSARWSPELSWVEAPKPKRAPVRLFGPKGETKWPLKVRLFSNGGRSR